MYLKRAIEITCTNCSNKYKAMAWNSINVTIHEDAKESILDDDFFKFRCPICGERTHLAYDTLYHDMKQRVMIYLINNYDKNNEKLMSEMEELSESLIPKFGDEYKLRIVNNNYDLIEKIKIFDCSLDDRIMEIAKTNYSLNLKKEQPDIIFENIYFDYDKDRYKNILKVFSSTDEFLIYDMDSEVYKAVNDNYSEFIRTNCGGRFEVVDRDWATEIINIY